MKLPDIEQLRASTQFLDRCWHEKKGLFGSLLLISLLALSNIENSSRLLWFLLALLPLTIVVWYYSNRIPRAKKNHLGFVTCIDCPEEAEARKIKEDFIKPLKRLLGHCKLGERTTFIEIPQWKAKDVSTLVEADRLREAAHAHFMVYGYVRKRVIAKKEHHIIELHGLVTHAAIPKHISKRISSEFAELFPNKVQIDSDNDSMSFDFTTEWTAVVAHYIIGVAAAVSGDLLYAESMFVETSRLLAQRSHAFPIFQLIKARIPQRIEEIERAKANIAYDNWTRDRSYENFSSFSDAVAKLDGTSNRLHPETSNFKAIASFVATWTCKDAFAYLNKCAQQDSTWRVNVAFLKAYDGDLRGAVRLYKKAAKEPIAAETLALVEEFICWVIEVKPERFQLYYLLAQFNLILKEDCDLAKKDFREFMIRCPNNTFAIERAIAEEQLFGRIDRVCSGQQIPDGDLDIPLSQAAYHR